MRRAVCCLLILSLVIIVACSCGRADRDEPREKKTTPTGPAGEIVFGDDGIRVAQAIGAASIGEVIAEIASDEYGGRGPSTEGDRKTRDFLSRRLGEIGFAPGGTEGAWEQPIGLVGLTSRMPPTWAFKGAGSEHQFAWWDEFIAASGVQDESTAIGETEVVFVGYGIVAPEESWDDYKGADLEGKILLMLNNDPDWDEQLFAGRRRLYYGRWTYKYQSAAAQGAAGAIIIHTDKSAGYPWQVVQTSWTGEQFELPAGDEPRVKLAGWLTFDAARELAKLGGRDLDELVASARSRDFEPVPLGVSTSIAFSTRVNKTESANVLGLLEGRDERLKDEYVIYTAHHDHLGTGQPDSTGDTIYNGAVDNAAGTAQVLAIADAFTRLSNRPRRSILIAFVGVEEQGLLGSLHYSLNPTVHPGRLAGNINIDGGNIWGRTKDVAVIGRGKSSLEQNLEAAARLQGRVVTDEPFPDKGYYYRSDQLNFARIGVPALYFKSGTVFVGRPDGWGVKQTEDWIQNRYHQPSDELDDTWNFDGMVEDARLAFLVGLAAANTEELPAWRPGDEFEAARSAALADLAGD